MVKDFLLDEAGDLRIENGDFVIAESDQQHIELLLLSTPGEWRQNPTAGIAAQDSLLDDESTQEFSQHIRKQLSLDGATVNAITITETQINIDANY